MTVPATNLTIPGNRNQKWSGSIGICYYQDMPNGYSSFRHRPLAKTLRFRSGATVLLLVFWVLGGCAINGAEFTGTSQSAADPAETREATDKIPGAGKTTDGPATAENASTEPRPASPAESGNQNNEQVTELSAELLHDVLLAAIAGQRRQHDVALDALTRAVYLSRDKRLNTNAIQLALHLKDYRKAIELSRLMLADHPGNYRVRLALATAQIKSGQSGEAARTLIELAREQGYGDESILQEIATLIARQKESDTETLEALLLDSAESNEPTLLFTSALLASQQNREAEFRSRLDQVLSVDPEWEMAAMLKLTELSARDNGDSEANTWASRYIDEHPDATQFRIQYAQILIQQENLEDALNHLNEVIRLQPDSTDALFTAAMINMDTEQYPEAKKQLRRFISLSNNADQARLFLARILIQEEDYTAASPLLRQIQSRQYYLDAQIALSQVIAKQSNVNAGLSYLRNINVRAENDQVRLILEQDSLLRTFDMKNRSLELLSEALEERPQHPDLLYSRGLLAAQLNKLELIEQDMRQLIELQPDNAHAYNALGYTLADQTDRYDEALELISTALEFLPEDPFILDSMGWVNFRIGNHSEALDYLQRAIDLKQDPEIAAHLGEVLWVTGDQGEAINVWQQGKEWGADNQTLIETMDRLLGETDDQRAQWITAASPLA